eukprot:641196-Pyramimonas_sp.AAC.1
MWQRTYERVTDKVSEIKRLHLEKPVKAALEAVKAVLPAEAADDQCFNKMTTDELRDIFHKAELSSQLPPVYHQLRSATGSAVAAKNFPADLKEEAEKYCAACLAVMCTISGLLLLDKNASKDRVLEWKTVKLSEFGQKFNDLPFHLQEGLGLLLASEPGTPAAGAEGGGPVAAPAAPA